MPRGRPSEWQNTCSQDKTNVTTMQAIRISFRTIIFIKGVLCEQ